MQELNLQSPGCKPGALPIKLIARKKLYIFNEELTNFKKTTNKIKKWEIYW